jgi:hypothetical protein
MDLADTRLVLALVALVLVCLTVLVALGKVSPEQAGIWAGGVLNGLALAWKRKDKAKKPAHPAP